MNTPVADIRHNPSRRSLLRTGGGFSLGLGLTQLAPALSVGYVREVLAAQQSPQYSTTADLYRQIWQWDKVAWGSHTNACLPGCCSFRVYVKDGIVWREEQTANAPGASGDYPDYNPLGCQKGCSFHANLTGDERVKYPLRRVGERGSGQWERISWDMALEEIAGALVDALDEQGGDGFILDPPHGHLGNVGWVGAHRFTHFIGGVAPDLNLIIGDFLRGTFDTVGKQLLGYSADNLFDAELIFLACSNWSYTMPSVYHFLTEARYNGTEIVSIAPDYNPTSITADYHVPVRQGCDAAFWLGICQVMMDQGLIDQAFVREQTDLPLLVRTDTGRFLRQTDVQGSGREDQLYFWDEATGALAPAPRGTLAFAGIPALAGEFAVTLADGTGVRVSPVYVRVKAHLDAHYTPEQAAAESGVHASLIRTLAGKVATRRTAGYVGFTSAKIYHGDLGERALILAMALSGNWGKPGTGWNSFALAADHVQLMMVLRKPISQGGMAELAQMEQAFAAQLRAADPEISEELISIELTKAMTAELGVVPPIFFFWHHCGYKELYDTPGWQDPSYTRPLSAYMEDAVRQGWWGPQHMRPAPDKTPRVMMVISGNPMRRNRSGALMLPKHLFPKLKMLFAIEPRMSSTAMFCDIVLPAAWYYEKEDMTISSTTNPHICYIENAVTPQGEARPEWEILAELCQRVGRIAAARGLETYVDGLGREKRYDALWPAFTMDGQLLKQADVLGELVTIAEATGIFKPGTDLAAFRKAGQMAQQGFGQGFMKHLAANEYTPGKPIFSLRWHVDEKKTYPTYTRRAQFYIDHPWYLEAGEAVPTHKPPPKIGGDYPFSLTGGHPRHSVHSTHLAAPQLMRLHRAQPVMHINDRVASARGVKDGERVRVYNDVADFEIMLRTSPTVAPDQAVIYFWEQYQFPEWKVYDRLLVGQPKPLHLAGGYGQLRYYFYNGGPGLSTDRGVRVEIEKLPV